MTRRSGSRSVCDRCLRPEGFCYCGQLTEIVTDSRVVILQHPREEGMPIGTARMAHLCLPNSSLHVGVEWDGSAALAGACEDPERPAVLLYPGAEAQDIMDAPPAGPVTLVVVDGTWSQAKNIVRDSPQLAALPRYTFTPPAPSNYRIRNEPMPNYVSTLEAIMHVLGALEGDADRFRSLMAPMNAMIDAQMAAEAERHSPRVRRRKKLEPHQRLPVEIRDRFEDLVLVFGDANAWPMGTPERELGDELVHWVAMRPSTGESMSFVLAPRIPLAPDVPGHTGVALEELESGGRVEDLLAEFAAFLQPADVVASWGHHSVRMFQDCGGVLPGEFLDLRETARALSEGKVGALERYAANVELAERAPLLPGRAGHRLGLLAAVVADWRSWIPESESDGA